MRAPNDFPQASVGEVKSSADDVPRPSSSSPADGDGANDVIDHSFLPPPPSSNTIERRTPPVYRYADAAAALTATATPPGPPMPPSISRQSYYNPGYYAHGGHHQDYYHAGYNYGHRHPAGYHPTTDDRKDASDVTAATTTSAATDPTPITPRDDDPTPLNQPQRRDDAGSNTAPSTPPPAVPSSEVLIPDSDISDKDVLSGRGGGTNNHFGNKEFRSLVDQYRSEYVLSKKWAKREIARNIVVSIRSSGGRFLKKEGYGWRDIGDQKAGEKTSQALREGLAAKMRAAYAESSGTSASHQASASRRPPSAPAPAPAPTPAGEPSSSSARPQGPEYYRIPPHDFQYYSPDSVSGQDHPRSSDPTSSASYEPYDYTPYEYSPEAYMRSPPLLSSPVKRRRLTYSTGEPSQTKPV